jgi:transposase-like protein
MDNSRFLSKPNKYQPRQLRVFSTELKKKLVEQIELKRLNIQDVVYLYHTTKTSVYRWLREYSTLSRNGTKMVVESESQDSKLDKLREHIDDLERLVGRKQLEIDFLNKVIEICSSELGYDVKKKCTTSHLNGID